MHKLLIAAVLLVPLLAACTSSPDGQVEGERPSAAEYREVKEAAVACIEAAGFDADLTPDESGKFLYLGVTAPDGMESEVDRVVNECETEHGNDIVLAYERPGSLTGEAREEEMKALVACLDEAGVTGLSAAETDSRVFVREIMSYGLQSEVSDAGLRCLERHRDVWPVGDANNPAP